MPPVARVRLPIMDVSGASTGVVQVALLPGKGPSDATALLDERTSPDADASLAPVQLLEGEEYRYEIVLQTGAGRVETDRPEVFEPDTPQGGTGRLRPGLYTGTLPVAIWADGHRLGEVAFEVRSRKLDYLTHFRWMLRDIADEAAEVVMERFAPAEQRFAIDDSADAATLYQRFAFLRSLIADDSLEAAIRQIVSRPHLSWEEEEENRRTGQGVRVSSAVARQLACGANRVPCPPRLATPIRSLPRELNWWRTETTVDTVPNRFVKFAVTRWRDVLLAISDGLQKSVEGAAGQRGIREVGALLDRLDEVLGEEVFREVGDLTAFPGDNQVLQKREGYRDVFRTYLQFELAAKLAWRGGDDVYHAGQRDVATLYEYWTFLQLGRIIARLGNAPFDFSSLVEVDARGLSVSLRRGHVTLVFGLVERLGRQLRLELAFNRTFATGAGSWSRSMRPDCSLEILPDPPGEGGFEPVWLHFDAKYRVDNLAQVLDQELDAESHGEAKRADLLKMHSYRDAIRRSAGAYVLYPGSGDRSFREYHELLPGLGAFALRPTDYGEPTGSEGLARFLEDVFEHIANQITQHERGRYWTRRVYERPVPRVDAPAVRFLRRPPADTPVLLGYVRGRRHLDWIHKT
ncbi:MAG TPA: DUF2357 domain-containing protein, partial [Thermoleophilia bacterium]|nr:DUF2357 domain-containing protein [Thermoleophilia bacterium]